MAANTSTNKLKIQNYAYDIGANGQLVSRATGHYFDDPQTGLDINSYGDVAVVEAMDIDWRGYKIDGKNIATTTEVLSAISYAYNNSSIASDQYCTVEAYNNLYQEVLDNKEVIAQALTDLDDRVSTIEDDYVTYTDFRSYISAYVAYSNFNTYISSLGYLSYEGFRSYINSYLTYDHFKSYIAAYVTYANFNSYISSLGYLSYDGFKSYINSYLTYDHFKSYIAAYVTYANFNSYISSLGYIKSYSYTTSVSGSNDTNGYKLQFKDRTYSVSGLTSEANAFSITIPGAGTSYGLVKSGSGIGKATIENGIISYTAYNELASSGTGNIVSSVTGSGNKLTITYNYAYSKLVQSGTGAVVTSITGNNDTLTISYANIGNLVDTTQFVYQPELSGSYDPSSYHIALSYHTSGGLDETSVDIDIPAATTTNYGVMKITSAYHYSPSGGTATNTGTTVAGNGKAITGMSLTKDDKGHVTAFSYRYSDFPSYEYLANQSYVHGTGYVTQKYLADNSYVHGTGYVTQKYLADYGYLIGINDAPNAGYVIGKIGVNGQKITYAYVAVPTYEYLANQSYLNNIANANNTGYVIGKIGKNGQSITYSYVAVPTYEYLKNTGYVTQKYLKDTSYLQGAPEATNEGYVIGKLGIDGQTIKYSYVSLPTYEYLNVTGYLTEHQSLEDYVTKPNAIKNVCLSVDNSSYIITLSYTIANAPSTTLTKTVDLPLESVVVNGYYKADNKEVHLELKNGAYVKFPIGDLVSGLVSTDQLSAQGYVNSQMTIDKYGYAKLGNSTQLAINNSNKIYGVGITSSGQLAVSVPWENTITENTNDNTISYVNYEGHGSGNAINGVIVNYSGTNPVTYTVTYSYTTFPTYNYLNTTGYVTQKYLADNSYIHGAGYVTQKYLADYGYLNGINNANNTGYVIGKLGISGRKISYSYVAVPTYEYLKGSYVSYSNFNSYISSLGYVNVPMTTNTYGYAKLGDSTVLNTSNNKVYGVGMTSGGQLAVSVPWDDPEEMINTYVRSGYFVDKNFGLELELAYSDLPNKTVGYVSDIRNNTSYIQLKKMTESSYGVAKIKSNTSNRVGITEDGFLTYTDTNDNTYTYVSHGTNTRGASQYVSGITVSKSGSGNEITYTVTASYTTLPDIPDISPLNSYIRNVGLADPSQTNTGLKVTLSYVVGHNTNNTTETNIPKAGVGTYGVAKAYQVSTISANTLKAYNATNYPMSMTSNGYAYVAVPWTDTKVTSAANHYTPSGTDVKGTKVTGSNLSFGGSVVTEVSYTADSKGHITKLSYKVSTLPSETQLSLGSASGQFITALSVSNHQITATYGSETQLSKGANASSGQNVIKDISVNNHTITPTFGTVYDKLSGTKSSGQNVVTNITGSGDTITITYGVALTEDALSNYLTSYSYVGYGTITNNDNAGFKIGLDKFTYSGGTLTRTANSKTLTITKADTGSYGVVKVNHTGQTISGNVKGVGITNTGILTYTDTNDNDNTYTYVTTSGSAATATQYVKGITITASGSHPAITYTLTASYGTLPTIPDISSLNSYVRGIEISNAVTNNNGGADITLSYLVGNNNGQTKVSNIPTASDSTYGVVKATPTSEAAGTYSLVHINSLGQLTYNSASANITVSNPSGSTGNVIAAISANGTTISYSYTTALTLDVLAGYVTTQEFEDFERAWSELATELDERVTNLENSYVSMDYFDQYMELNGGGGGGGGGASIVYFGGEQVTNSSLNAYHLAIKENTTYFHTYLPKASDSTYGLIKVKGNYNSAAGSPASSGTYYPLQISSDGIGVVRVPTSTGGGGSDPVSSVEFAPAIGKLSVANSGSADTIISAPIANSSNQFGLLKLYVGSNQVAGTSPSITPATSGNYYPVNTTSAGIAYVRVPTSSGTGTGTGTDPNAVHWASNGTGVSGSGPIQTIKVVSTPGTNANTLYIVL